MLCWTRFVPNYVQCSLDRARLSYDSLLNNTTVDQQMARLRYRWEGPVDTG